MFSSKSKRNIHKGRVNKSGRTLTPLILILTVFLIATLLAVRLISNTLIRSELVQFKETQKTDDSDMQNDSENNINVTIPEKFNPPEGSVFIPYWKVDNVGAKKSAFELLPSSMSHSSIRNIIYFGASPQSNGSITVSEPGYAGISKFARFFELADFASDGASISEEKNPTRTLLTIRMLDESINEDILTSAAAQEVLAAESIQLLKSHNFDGVVLDLEHSVLPTTDTVQNISSFISSYAQKLHSNNLYVAVTIYGDTFYRQRPYNVKKIAENVDEVMIMAYDFHKSYGEPGPNFPFSSGNLYDYDFVSMIEDFLQVVPSKKISVIFGLYGYSWTVDSENRPVKPAKASTLSEIENTILPNCTSACNYRQDELSKEGYIEDARLTQTSGYKSVVWYENAQSVKAKTGYLSTRNIHSVGYWAFGYAR